MSEKGGLKGIARRGDQHTPRKPHPKEINHGGNKKKAAGETLKCLNLSDASLLGKTGVPSSKRTIHNGML